ncbi:MAG: GDSL-type esterase/lipase family protein [Polyangiaceae bacterium]
MSKPTAAVGVLLVLLAIPYLSPKLARFRTISIPGAPSAAAVATTTPAAPAPPPTVGDQALGASENRSSVANALPDKPVVVDPEVLAKTAGSVAIEGDEAMHAFYMHLADTISKKDKAVTRVLHYGDSVITSDYVSGTLRRKLQTRFGDAGHGFILVANAWEWYFHNDVMHYASSGWTANRISGPLAKNAEYGLGGAVFRGVPGSSATFGTASSGTYGRKVSHFDVYYLAQPGGGDIEVKVSGEAPQTFSTKDEDAGSAHAAIHRVDVADGEAKMTLRAAGRGELKVYGVALERDAPGVVVDALGALGARMKMWEPVPEEHLREQFDLRKPALIVLQFGTNESEDGGINAPEYEKTLSTVLQKWKRAAVGASILVASPLDRAERDANGRLRSNRVLMKIVDLQQKIAAKEGVAFWNTWKAMGGEGSMGRWLNAKPQLCSGDLTHPTPAGAEVIGDLFYKALAAGYAGWSSNQKGAPPLPAE